MQIPTDTLVTLLPAIVQTGNVELVYDTARPDDAVAKGLNATGIALNGRFACGPNVIVCGAWVIITLCVSDIAALKLVSPG